MNNPIDVMTLGKVLAQSGYFSDAREAAQAVVKVLAGQELGIGPIASMTGISIIKGQVTLGANLMAGIIKSQEKYDYKINEHTIHVCSIEYFQNGKSIGVSTFAMSDAKQAGLMSKSNWRNYPRNMLFARAMSNGAKWFCPDAFNGQTVYTSEELEILPQARISTEDQEQVVIIKEYLKDLSDPAPIKMAKVKQAIEDGELVYSSEITMTEIAEWSK